MLVLLNQTYLHVHFFPKQYFNAINFIACKTFTPANVASCLYLVFAPFSFLPQRGPGL